MYIKSLLLLLLGYLCQASVEESLLRSHLFQNYDNKVRPVKNDSIPLLINMGLAVQNLEEFNQMEESLKLNIWLRSNWNDEYLEWNSSVSNISFLSVNDDIWLHDIELMNAAGKPDLYLLNGGENLYSSGNIMWSKPAIFKFSCSLNLEKFPFDKQVCRMKFGSWLFSNRYLSIRPYDNVDSQIDILDSFSHSEWQYIDSSLQLSEESRECCPGELFDIITYEFVFKRYPHYYKLSMGMTISLVIASFIIMLMEPDNVSRTGTAVFIPLTILALQLTIADKIPVVGYETLMDKFFICCFVSSMVVSIESGIIFALITTKSKYVRHILSKIFEIDKLKKKVSSTSLTSKNDDINQEEVASIKEFDETVKVIQTSFTEDSNMRMVIKSEAGSTETVESPVPSHESPAPSHTESVISHESPVPSHAESVISQDVVKTIDYNDDILKFTYNEKLLMDELKRIIRKSDNYFRAILPLVFFIYIAVIYSYEEDI